MSYKILDSEDDEYLIMEVTCECCGRKEIIKDETVPDCWWQLDDLLHWDSNNMLCEVCADGQFEAERQDRSFH